MNWTPSQLFSLSAYKWNRQLASNPHSLLQNIISNNFPVNSSVAVQSPDFLSDDFEQVWSGYRNRDHTLYAQGKKQVTSRFVFVILYSDLPKKTLKLLGNNLDTDIFFSPLLKLSPVFKQL